MFENPIFLPFSIVFVYLHLQQVLQYISHINPHMAGPLVLSVPWKKTRPRVLHPLLTSGALAQNPVDGGAGQVMDARVGIDPADEDVTIEPGTWR